MGGYPWPSPARRRRTVRAAGRSGAEPARAHLRRRGPARRAAPTRSASDDGLIHHAGRMLGTSTAAAPRSAGVVALSCRDRGVGSLGAARDGRALAARPGPEGVHARSAVEPARHDPHDVEVSRARRSHRSARAAASRPRPRGDRRGVFAPYPSLAAPSASWVEPGAHRGLVARIGTGPVRNDRRASRSPQVGSQRVGAAASLRLHPRDHAALRRVCGHHVRVGSGLDRDSTLV